MRTCGSCDHYHLCLRASHGMLSPDAVKCVNFRPDGTSAWKMRKLRGAEKRKTRRDL
jgi:hypothetical protein